MRRSVIACVLALAGVAHADDGEGRAESEDDIGDQSVGADIGIAGGGRVTPGGLRLAGHYLYQLSSEDWFDGTASFTYGGGGTECFRDRMNTFTCEHGFTDGSSVEISANVRRVFSARGSFRPFARAGIGIALLRFSDDDVSGIGIPLHAGGGVRAWVADGVAVVAQGEIQVGIARFGHDLGAEPQLGLTITAGAEFRLR
jgi:opacity protein-like surface antigen